MPKKQRINALIKELEQYSESLEGVDASLEKNLEIYEKSIATSKALLTLLDRQKKTFTTLNQKAEGLFDG